MITLILLIGSVEVIFLHDIQGDHSNCPSSSSCHMVPYVASKDLLIKQSISLAVLYQLPLKHIILNPSIQPKKKKQD